MQTTAVRARLAVITAVLAAVAALAALVLLAPAASAHSDLESSDPQDGAVLAVAPEAVSFTFNEDLLDQGNAITLTDLASGSRLALGEVTVSGDTISVPWPAASPAGDFRAAYRVVSADGHPIDGTITFTVQAAAGQASGPASPDPSGTASAPSSSPPPSSPSPSALPEETEDETSIAWMLGIGLVCLVGAGAALWRMRRNR